MQQTIRETRIGGAMHSGMSPLKENFQKHKRRPTRALRWNADEKRLIL